VLLSFGDSGVEILRKLSRYVRGVGENCGRRAKSLLPYQVAVPGFTENACEALLGFLREEGAESFTGTQKMAAANGKVHSVTLMGVYVK